MMASVIDQDVRRDRLRQWIKEHHREVVTQFALKVQKKQSQIADMLDGRKAFGEKVARDLELRAGMPPGFLDATDDKAKALIWSAPISEEEAEIGRAWGKLEEPMRTAVREMIYLKIGTQVRRRRSAPVSTHRARPKRKRDGGSTRLE